MQKLSDNNATSLFIVPLFNIKRVELIKHGYENAFIKDEMREIEYKNVVFLLFRPFKSADEFNTFIEEERKRGAPLIDEYDYPDGWTVLVYQYDEKWEPDVKILMTGKYSRVSEKFKNKIPAITVEYANGIKKEKRSLQHNIFEKALVLKEYWKKELDIDLTDEDEFFSFYPEREILTKETLKKLK